MEMLLQDIRYSLRTMAKNPGFVAAVVVSLTLGIGLNTVIFSLVNALLLRPLPVDRPDQLVRVFRSDGPDLYSAHSYPDYVDYRDRQQIFTGLAACQRVMMSLNIDGSPEAVAGAVVSANFFSVLGAQPSLGRAFTPDEDQILEAHPVAIISYNLWRRRFNGDPVVLGKPLRLNGQIFTVIGVAAEGFNGVDVVFATEVWVPITMYPKLMPSDAQSLDPVNGRDQTWLNDVIGRLRPGVSRDQARSSLNVISAQLDKAYPGRDENQKRVVDLIPVSHGQPEIRTAILSFTALLMAAVVIVLLIVCANVANLLLARAAARHREVAIRMALGASRWRLVRQLLTESVMLALAGGAAGVLLTYWARDLLLAFKPSISIPILVDLSPDWRVLGFSLAISFLTGIAFGLIPALRTSRPDLASALKAEMDSSGRGGRGSRLHGLLVVAQVALSLMLLIGAGLLFRSMRNAYEADPGFRKKNILLLSTDLELRGYTVDEGGRFYRRLMDRMQTLPGLRSASLTSIFPLSLASSKEVVVVDGHESKQRGGMTEVRTASVAPRYFETLDIPVIQGRDFSYHDTETGPRVVIINQAMASHFWPGENPIGKWVNRDPLATHNSGYEVIGVAKDGKFGNLWENPQPVMYKCLQQQYRSTVTLVAHTESDSEEMLMVLRHEIQSLDGDLPVFDVKTAAEHMNLTLFPLRMATVLLGLLGALALLLASVGLYAVVSYSVTLRTHELGIRMALGAGSIQVLRQVLRRGMTLAMIGVAIGLVFTLALARSISSLGLIHGIGAADLAIFLGASFLLVSVAGLASYLPARRATKIDPAIAIHQK